MTVPRTGYRLVRPASAPAAMPAAPAVATIAVDALRRSRAARPSRSTSPTASWTLITALSRFKSFAVVSRTSTFAYKHKAADTARRAANWASATCLRAACGAPENGCASPPTGRLRDRCASLGREVRRRDRRIFAFQDTITERVVGLVDPTIRKAEIERARRKPPESLVAYDLFLKACPGWPTAWLPELHVGYRVLEKAIEIELTFATALAFAGWPLRAFEPRQQ